MPRIDEPGGDYVSVSVERNGILIYKRDAVLSEALPAGVTRWKVDDTDLITVPPTQDALDIAKRIMNTKGKR